MERRIHFGKLGKKYRDDRGALLKNILANNW
jgi:hypothetical protein